MRHPFAEILPAEPIEEQRPTRRSALARTLSLLAGASAFFGGRRAIAQASDTDAEADTAKPKLVDQGNGKAAQGYRLYFVVPKSIRKFTTARREALGVDGPYVHGWEGNENWKKSKGFLAWTTREQAKKILAADDVLAAHEIIADDKIKTGNQNGSGGKLTVTLMPNGWANKPAADRYYSAKQLAENWAKKFKSHVTFAATEGGIVVKFKTRKMDDDVVNAIAANPQVTHLAWASRPTTRAIGEEGGPTTKRRGEEGGPRPTTLRVGEEGATTLAIGEEGGGPFPRPIPRPIPRPLPEPLPPRKTTLALGEEGGGLRIKRAK